jgi:hypothetical protein
MAIRLSPNKRDGLGSVVQASLCSHFGVDRNQKNHFLATIIVEAQAPFERG